MVQEDKSAQSDGRHRYSLKEVLKCRPSFFVNSPFLAIESDELLNQSSLSGQDSISNVRMGYLFDFNLKHLPTSEMSNLSNASSEDSFVGSVGQLEEAPIDQSLDQATGQAIGPVANQRMIQTSNQEVSKSSKDKIFEGPSNKIGCLTGSKFTNLADCKTGKLAAEPINKNGRSNIVSSPSFSDTQNSSPISYHILAKGNKRQLNITGHTFKGTKNKYRSSIDLNVQELGSDSRSKKRRLN